MAPTKPKTTRKATITKHKPETTKMGEKVLDLVIPYINSVEDRNSVALVSRKLCETDGITRKRLTIHTLYSNPSHLSTRFPFIESLTIKGPPSMFRVTDSYVIRITPWIEQLALKFRCLKELHISRLVVNDEDLETLTRTRGKDLRSLKIQKCQGFSTDGLENVSKYCNQLRTLCLNYNYNVEVKDGIWLHQLALYSRVLERLDVRSKDFSNNAQELTLLAKNCCNSLKSLKIGDCYLSKLGDAFRYAVRLEHFSGYNCDEESDLVGFEFPQNMCSISIEDLPRTRGSIVFPFSNRIRKLKLVHLEMDKKCQCLLYKRCTNLEVLYTVDECRSRGLQFIGKFCRKLRKLTHRGLVTHVGLIALAKGCTNLESLDVYLEDISNEALECVGTHLKNLGDFRMHLINDDGTTRVLDNGIRAMLMGCRKLERLDIYLGHGGLTDVGLEYIGKYGVNLRSLSLDRVGNSNAGLEKLSQGCKKLRKLKLFGCPFSKQVVTKFVFNIQSLRYVWGWSSDGTTLALTRPDFQLWNIGRSKLKRKSATTD